MRSIKKKIIDLKSMKDAQFQSFHYDDYNLGLYNGIELSLSIMEEREPKYLTLPLEENI